MNNLKIILNENEKIIFNLLRNIIVKKKLNIVLRVAGGWVRDKILGFESNDIDIAVDNYNVEDFAIKIQEHYLEDQNIIKKFNIIKSNPEKFKHLETVTMKIFKQEIEFVNLRYDKEIKDKAKMDALLRDFTINSLFYNINNEIIEDFTNYGIFDLENKILRTPLLANETFSHDPLRILRCFRFMSKLNYSLDQSIVDAWKLENIIFNLNKVSKERIGIEFFKSIKMEYNYLFFEQIKNFNLQFILLNNDILSSNENNINFDNNINKVINLLKNKNYNLLFTNIDKNEWDLIVVLCVLLYNISSEKNIANFLIRENLKLPNKYKTIVELILKNTYILNDFIENNTEFNVKFIEFLSLWLKEIKEFWEIVFLLNNNIEIYNYIIKNNFQEFYKEKLLLNGNEIKKEFAVEKQEIRLIINKMIVYQAQNRNLNITKQDFINDYKKFN